jgi:hypothetical protein
MTASYRGKGGRIVSPVLLMPESWHKELAELNFRNKVHYNQKELKKIRSGHKAKIFFNSRELTRFRREGLLSMRRTGPRTTKYVLSDKAERVLTEVLGEI